MIVAAVMMGLAETVEAAETMGVPELTGATGLGASKTLEAP